MLQKRVIPILLLKGRGLVKSVKFKDFTYIGDPINAVKIFNEKEVDEIILIDILASKDNREPDFDLISEIGSEAFVPFAYGGGVSKMAHVKKLLYAGAEKVVLNTSFLKTPKFVTEVADAVGSSSTVVAIDVKKNFWGKYRLYNHQTGALLDMSPLDAAMQARDLGAGELMINSVDSDGTMKGYDLALFKQVSDQLDIPVIACGGAGNLEHIKDLFSGTNIAAAAAGSVFIYHGKHKAVLINYPERAQLDRLQL